MALRQGAPTETSSEGKGARVCWHVCLNLYAQILIDLKTIWSGDLLCFPKRKVLLDQPLYLKILPKSAYELLSVCGVRRPVIQEGKSVYALKKMLYSFWIQP